MRRFYKQIRFDLNLKRFYVACTVCGERFYGKTLPLICLTPIRTKQLECGQGSWVEQ